MAIVSLYVSLTIHSCLILTFNLRVSHLFYFYCTLVSVNCTLLLWSAQYDIHLRLVQCLVPLIVISVSEVNSLCSLWII